MFKFKPSGMASAALMALLATLPMQLTAAPDNDKLGPQEVRMTWYGITNWHYQIGDVGVLLDGESVNGALSAASVTKQLNTVKLKGTVDVILAGHVHPDHTNQMRELVRQSNAKVYGPAALCTTLRNAGLPAERCVGVLGGEKITLSPFAAVRVVRWVHSVDCDSNSNGTGGPETFGFLFTVNTKNLMAQDHIPAHVDNPGDPRAHKILSWYVSDSGAGNEDLFIPRVAGGVTYGSPMQNLAAALEDAGLTTFDIWQGGPESRMVAQAKHVVPTFGVKVFMPHHLAARGNAQSSFKLEYGMHYPYSVDDQPKLKTLLDGLGVPQVFPENYWDAWVLDKHGIKQVANVEQKAVYGIPATGPGPGVQGTNPRAGQLECPQD
jgi:hypothetical protein